MGAVTAGPTVFHLLDVSTGHLKLSTREILEEPGVSPDDEPRFFPRYAAHEYGWFMWVATDPENIAKFLEDVAAVVRFAHQHRCEWILFDQDAAPTPDLPFYGDGDEPEPPADS
jgi:hypothetical protein